MLGSSSGRALGEESTECWCGTSIYVQSLAHHILHDHIGTKSWACGACDFQSPDLNSLFLHSFRQRHDPRSIFSPSLERLLKCVGDVWSKAGGEELPSSSTNTAKSEPACPDSQETTNSPSTSSRDEDALHEGLESGEGSAEAAEESDHSHTDSRDDSPFSYSPSKRLRLMPQFLSNPVNRVPAKSEGLDLGQEIRRKLEAAHRASPSALTRLWVMKGLGGGLPLRGTPSPSLPMQLHPKAEELIAQHQAAIAAIPIVRDSLDGALNRLKVPKLEDGEVKADSDGGATGMPPWNRICALCGLSVRVYNNRNQIHRGYIQTHVHRRHLDVYGWACSECGKHFKSKDTARAHVRGSHADAPSAKAALTCPPELYARQTKEAMVRCFPDIDMSFYKVITE